MERIKCTCQREGGQLVCTVSTVNRKSARKKSQKITCLRGGDEGQRGLYRVYKQRLQQDVTSPQRRRRRRADFNLKCSCFSKSLFASLSLSLPLFHLCSSDCICCVCKSVWHTDTSRLQPAATPPSARPQNSCYCLAFEFFSLSKLC